MKIGVPRLTAEASCVISALRRRTQPWLTFRPTLPTAGDYEVSVWWMPTTPPPGQSVSVSENALVPRA